jgi:hypothetical protein
MKLESFKMNHKGNRYVCTFYGDNQRSWTHQSHPVSELDIPDVVIKRAIQERQFAERLTHE